MRLTQNQKILNNLMILLCGIHCVTISICDSVSQFKVAPNYNSPHNTLRLFDVLTNFAFTTSETKLDY